MRGRRDAPSRGEGRGNHLETPKKKGLDWVQRETSKQVGTKLYGAVRERERGQTNYVEIKVFTMKTTDCYIFDIDGTVADLSHRLHFIERKPKKWREFFAASADDKAITHIRDLARHLSKVAPVVFVSGRSDEVRAETEAWLKREIGQSGPLYMRRRNDRRPDYIVKAELLDQLLADGYRPIMAFDDRDQVVKMWREKGVPCAQVAEGNF
jgi:hypothetical protein